MQNKPINFAKLFWLFTLTHVLLWTLLPTLFRHTLPIDTLEGALWGHQLEWGYDKNPFVNAWLTEFAIFIAGQHAWIMYFFCQLCVASCFWSVWRLGQKIVAPIYALCSVLLLESVQYFNIASLDLDDNIIELPLWSLLSLCFYNALKKQRYLDWLLVGLLAGLAMMTKYFAVVLFLPMLLFLLSNSERRQTFKKPEFYTGIFLFLVIISPHTVWLFQHDFITIGYAFNQVSAPSTWLIHITEPLNFALMQVLTFAPALLVFLFLILGKKTSVNSVDKKQLVSFDKQFLFTMGFGALLTTAALSLMLGMGLHVMWGTPLLSLWGLILIAWIQPTITAKQFKRFLSSIFFLMALLGSAYVITYQHAEDTSRANFPGKIIADSITHQWHERYQTPLKYVAGTRWVIGNISFYSKDRPTAYIAWDKKLSPWIDEKKMEEQGAVFIWEISHPEQLKLPVEIRHRFPNVLEVQPQYYSWINAKTAAPVLIGVAFLPPDNKSITVRLFPSWNSLPCKNFIGCSFNFR